MLRVLPTLLLLLALAGVAVAQEDGRAALVTSLQGSGTVVRPPEPVRLHNVMLLSSGDEVRLDAGARMTMTVFQGAQRIAAVGPCRIAVDAAGARLLEGPTPLSRSAGRLSPALAPGGRNLERMAGMVLPMVVLPEDGGPVSLTARIWTSPPVLTWKGGRGPFRIRVSGPEGQVWETVTSERKAACPGARLREDVTYGFEILPEGAEVGSYGEFRILSAAFRKKAREAEESAKAAAKSNPGDVTPWVLLMVLYNENDMLDEAIRAARQALKVQPADGGLHLALGKLLNLAGRTEEARAATDQARKLGASDF